MVELLQETFLLGTIYNSVMYYYKEPKFLHDKEFEDDYDDDENEILLCVTDSVDAISTTQILIVQEIVNGFWYALKTVAYKWILKCSLFHSIENEHDYFNNQKVGL